MQLKILNFPQLVNSNRAGLTNSPPPAIAYGSIATDLESLWSFVNFYKKAFEERTDLPKISSYGFNGSNLMAFSDIGSSGLSATNQRLYNTARNRPKTIYEALNELYRAIDADLNDDTVNQQILLLKNTIGSNIFSPSDSSTSSSLDARIAKNERNINQLAADIFNIEQSPNQSLTGYSLYNQGKQSQLRSIMDLLNILIEEHGGLNKINHDEIKKTYSLHSYLAGQSITNAGSFTCIPSSNTLFTGSQTAKFYNTTGKQLLFSDVGLYVETNTFSSGKLNVTMFKNGLPTGIVFQINQGYTGIYKFTTTGVEVEDGDYISFSFSPQFVGGGSEIVTVNNISINVLEIGD